MPQVIERVKPIETCATCTFFDQDQGMHGWCQAFDRLARPHHQRTAIYDGIAATFKSAAQSNALSSGYYDDNGVQRWEPLNAVDVEEEDRTIL